MYIINQYKCINKTETFVTTPICLFYFPLLYFGRKFQIKTNILKVNKSQY